MIELTSAQYRFRTAVPEGDFYEALGLTPKATSLDVDVAGARLAEQMPAMAQEVSRVVNVLSHRDRRTLHDAVRKVRDEAAESLDAHYGAGVPQFNSQFPPRTLGPLLPAVSLRRGKRGAKARGKRQAENWRRLPPVGSSTRFSTRGRVALALLCMSEIPAARGAMHGMRGAAAATPRACSSLSAAARLSKMAARSNHPKSSRSRTICTGKRRVRAAGKSIIRPNSTIDMNLRCRRSCRGET